MRRDLFLQAIILTFGCMNKTVKHTLLFLASLFFSYTTCYADKWQDSIISLLRVAKDSSKADQLNLLAESFADTDPIKSRRYATSAFQLSDSINYYKGSINSRDNLGYLSLLEAKYTEATKLYKEAITITQLANIPNKLAWLYNRLSVAYYYMGNYQDALLSYIKTSEHAKNENNKYTLLDAYNGMANIYMARSDYENTKQYYREALLLARNLNDSGSIALIEGNLGTLCLNQLNYVESLEHYQRSLDIYKTINDSSAIAMALVNIGNCNGLLGSFSEAFDFFNKSLEIYTRRNDKNKIAFCYLNIASAYSQKLDYNSAIDYLNKALKIANEIGHKEFIKKCYEDLADSYFKLGKFKPAYENFKLFSEVKDSLFNEANAKSMNELQTKFETEKKENEITRLNLQSDAQNARIMQQNIRTYFIATALVLVLIIVFVIYRQYKVTQTTNKELGKMNTAISKQKQEIEDQKLVVENQNKEITDSINYARQIQQAILPSSLLISKVLPDHFILYKPKAIVSGDFYFFAESSEKIFMAVVDCTGHGVPGAFMSMIGHNLLTQIINEKGVNNPAEVLNQLHKSVRHVLQQDFENTENRDGMDIALVVLDKNRKVLHFSGANRPLYLIRGKLINEIKGDKLPIGGLQFEAERRFTNHTVELNKGDFIYLFSDGYADQFGGEKGKKFMVKNLQKTLLNLYSTPINEQKNILNTIIENWRGNLEQIDDILLIGIEV